MYKALITDLDGTAVKLASGGKEVDQETRDTVTRAEEAGYHIACATRRSWSTAKSAAEALGLKSLCIISGGSAIIDPTTEEIVWEKPLDLGTTTKILEIFKNNAPDGYFYLPEYKEEVLINTVSKVDDQLRVMYLLDVSVNEATKVAALINASDFAVAHNTPSWHGSDLLDVHVTHPDATKEHAIIVWHEMMSISMAETIGMGDSNNDLPLLRAAGLKIAANNATPELKAVADYIVPEAADHALAYVINKFLLSQA